MAIWSNDESERIDYDLVVRKGFVTKYFSTSVLDEAVAALTKLNYRVARVDAGPWEGPSEMHRALASELSFPAYYGGNLDALNDCLSDVATGAYGWSSLDRGLVLVIDHFDGFLRKEPATAHAALDIFASRATEAALFGNRMFCLIGSDDPRLAVDSVGAQAVSWNRQEWLDRNRFP